MSDFKDLHDMIIKLQLTVDKLQEDVKELKNRPAGPLTEQQLKYTTLKDLYRNLAKAQGEMRDAEKNKDNPFFKSSYADYQSVFNTLAPTLSKYGLSVRYELFYPQEIGPSWLKVILAHESGQYVESIKRLENIKSENNAKLNKNQVDAGELTYWKRYLLLMITGAATGEEDNDGNVDVPVVDKSVISQAQYSWLIQEIDKLKPETISAIENALCKKYGIETLEDLPAKVFNVVIGYVKDQQTK